MSEIIKKLKNVNVDKEIKWIYNLVAYTIQHQNDENFNHKIKNRINSTIRSHSGEYRKYISDKKWDDYRRKEREKYKTDEKFREYQKEQQRIRRVVYNLYKQNELSNESNIKIANSLMSVENE